MECYLEKVNEDKKDVLYRLLQYSLFEESESDLNEMNDEALFEYRYFDNYFSDSDRDAFFIKEKDTNKLLGFVMVNSYVQKFKEGHSIAEYLIIPKYRRKGLGKKVATLIFEKYPGNWEVQPSFNNEKAYLFWKNVVESYKKDNYEYDGKIFTFTN